MKKRTYTRGRPVLLVGLLSLHALSSCVNTRPALGMGLCQSKSKAYNTCIKNDHEFKICDCDQGTKCPYIEKSSRRKASKRKLVRVAGVVTGGTALLGAAGGLWHLLGSPESNLSEHATTNITAALTTIGAGLVGGITSIGAALQSNTSDDSSSITTPLMPEGFTSPMVNMSDEEASRIIDAIHTSKWDTMNTTKSDSIEDATVVNLSLNTHVIDDLDEHSFSIDRIKHWLDQGLPVNSKSTSGQYLLSVAAKRNNLEAVKFLIENRADVNAGMATRESALLQALEHGTKGKDVVKYLRDHGAHLCTKHLVEAPDHVHKEVATNPTLVSALRKGKKCD